ncbi:MAG: SulP family inorganic anion transporter [Clostridia bacterium]|nr:SulP family inorganic anion transporter [Clostridia bacterium]
MIRSYFQMLRNEFSGYNAQKLGKDVMAGLTVTAVALPLALAFGVSCGASAAAGLVTAIIGGLIIGILSGASFQISGPTGAMSAILVGILGSFGLNGVFVVCFLAGILLVLCAIFKIGKLVEMIPRPVITGFTSGIAIIIALGQIDNFFGTTSVGESAIEKLLSYGKLGFTPDIETTLLGLLVVVLMIIWPKKWNAKIPGSLVGIIVATIVSILFGMDVATVGEIPKTLFLSERLSFANIEWAKFAEYISPAISIAALGMIESLLCGASASRMKNEKFFADQELLAQGVGNMLIPFFGGVPATAAIARTSVAIKSGCQTRLCGVFSAVGLLLSMFLLGPVMAKLPLSALAGVLMVTAWRMNEWESIRYFFGKGFKRAISKFLITMLATVVFDLTIAILIGIAYSAILFIFNAAGLKVDFSKVENKKFKGDENVEKAHKNTMVMYITGPIFFANVTKLSEAVQSLDDSCDELICSMRGVPAIDITGTEYIMELCEACLEQNRKIVFCGMNEGVKSMLIRAGVTEKLGEDVFQWSVDKVLSASVQNA